MASHVFNSIESQVFVRGDGIDHRVSVRAASTASVDLASNLNGASMDGVTLGTGDRILLKNQANVAEVTSIICVADVANSLDGKYFLLDSADGSQYYVWLNTPAGAGNPGPIGSRTGVMVSIATGATASAVASAVASAIDALTDFSAPAPGGTTVTVTDANTGPVNAAEDFDTGFTISRTTRGTSAIDNGIWEVGAGAGNTYRAEDLVADDDAAFCFVDVQDGSLYEKTQWTCCDKSGMAVVDTDPLTWVMSQKFNYAANDIFYAASSTELATLPSAASKVLVTTAGGVPDWSDYLPSGTNITGPFTMGDQIVNKEYVDGVAAGLDPKESVRLRTIDDISGTYNAAGGAGGTGEFTAVDLTDAGNWDLQTSPAVTIMVGDRVLVMNQADAKQNGIYVVTTAGAAGVIERAADQDGSPSNEVSGGNFTFTETGEVYSGTGWVVVHDGLLTLNTDDMNWTQYSTVGNWNAGDGIDITGNIVSADLLANGGIVFNGSTPAGQLQVDVGASALTGTLAANHGGTGHSMYAHGDLLVGNDSNPDTLNKLAAQSMGVLTVDYFAGSPGSPAVVKWSNDVNLSSILGVSALEPELLVFSNTNTAVNHLQISNAVTSNNPKLKAVGGDANVGLDLMSKGTGAISVMGDTNPGEVRFWNEADTFYTALKAQTVAQGLTSNVTFCLPFADGNANDILITNGSGILSFQTLNAVTRDSHSLMSLEVKANSTSLSPIAYFSWHEDEYSDVGEIFLLYEVISTNRDITVELYDETNSTSIASVTHVGPISSPNGFFSLDVSGILSIGGDARLSVRVKKSGNGGSNPRIYGIQIVFNPTDTPADN